MPEYELPFVDAIRLEIAEHDTEIRARLADISAQLGMAAESDARIEALLVALATDPEPDPEPDPDPEPEPEPDPEPEPEPDPEPDPVGMVTDVTTLESGARVWQLPIGNGGHVTQAVADLVGTDVSGLYRYNPNTGDYDELWPRNAPPEFFAGKEHVSMGVYGIAQCEAEPNELLLLAGNALWRSSDYGLTWDVRLEGLTADGNAGAPRSYQHKIAMHPHDPQVWVYSTEVECRETMDDGATWHADWPAPRSPGGGGGIGNSSMPPHYTCLTYSTSGGLFGHTAGVTYRDRVDISTGTVAQGLTFRNAYWINGQIAFCRADAGIARLDPVDDTWELIDTGYPDHITTAILVDPADPRRIVLAGHSLPAMAWSDDELETVQGASNWSTVESDSHRGIDWHVEPGTPNRAAGSFITTAAVGDDRVATLAGGNASPHRVPFDELFAAAQARRSPQVVSHAAGLDGLCVNLIAPIGRPDLIAGAGWAIACWDEGFMIDVDPDGHRWPRRQAVGHFNNSDGSNQSGWGLAVQRTPTGGPAPVIADWMTWEGRDNLYAGISTDLGRTWINWVDPHTGVADPANPHPWPYQADEFVRSGRLYMGNDPDFVVAVPGQTQNRGDAPHYTRNARDGRLAEWYPIVLDQAFADTWDDQTNQLAWLDRHLIHIDDDGLVWFLVHSIDPNIRGLWNGMLGDAGFQSWEKTTDLPYYEVTPGFWGWSSKLRNNPNDDSLWVCSGSQGQREARGSNNVARLDLGAWVRYAEIHEASDIAFTWTADHDNVLVVHGYVNGVWGLHACTNPDEELSSSRNWVTIWADTAPRNKQTFIRYMTGDPERPGVIGVAHECGGVLVYDITAALKQAAA